MMSAKQNMALARRFMEARINGDLVTVDEMIAPHFVNHNRLLPGQESDREDYLRGISAYQAALSERRLIIEDQVAGDDKVVTRFIVHATHGRDLPADGAGLDGGHPARCPGRRFGLGAGRRGRGAGRGRRAGRIARCGLAEHTHSERSLKTPLEVVAIRYWYEDFQQASDEEVIELIERSRGAKVGEDPRQ